jgi:hypothetical protein
MNVAAIIVLSVSEATVRSLAGTEAEASTAEERRGQEKGRSRKRKKTVGRLYAVLQCSSVSVKQHRFVCLSAPTTNLQSNGVVSAICMPEAMG